MVFTFDPFGLYNTNADDKTFGDEIQSYPRYLSRKFLYFNQRISFKTSFRIGGPYGVES